MDAAPPPRKSSPLALAVKIVVAVAVTVGTLWWAFHDVDLDTLKEDLAKTSLGVVAIYVTCQFVMHGVRTLRWWLLLAPLGRPSWRLVFSSVSIGIPASFFLPLRLGEFVRPAICARGGLPFGGAMAAVAAERIADGLLNVGLFFLLLRLLPASAQVPDELVGLSSVALVGFSGGVAFLVAAYFARGPVTAILRRVLSPISPKIADAIVGLVEAFVDGLRGLNSIPRLAGFFGTTVLFWGINGVATWYLATSYVEGLPILAGPFTICVTVFAVMIPTPAFAGTLEAGFRLGLLPFGVDASGSAAIAVVAHVVHLLFMATIAGLGFLFADTTSGAPPEA